MEWLNWLAAVFLGIAGLVSAVRYGRTRNNGQLFVTGCFLLAASIFVYLGLT